MSNYGKCPKCDKHINELFPKNIPAKPNHKETFVGIIYCCPLCDAILGAGIDPVLLANQIIEEIRKK